MPKRRQRKKSDRNIVALALTEQVYACIASYIAEHNIPPSIVEIAECANLSRGGVQRHLDKLEMQGRIKRDLNKKRSIALIEKKEE